MLFICDSDIIFLNLDDTNYRIFACKKLEMITVSKNVEQLDISQCPNIKEICGDLENIKVFKSPGDCKFIDEKFLAKLVNVEQLNISKNKMVMQMPIFQHLKSLNCNGSMIKEIPFMPKLTYICCPGCPMLTKISTNFPSSIGCENCCNLETINTTMTLWKFEWYNCPKLKNIPDSVWFNDGTSIAHVSFDDYKYPTKI